MWFRIILAPGQKKIQREYQTRRDKPRKQRSIPSFSEEDESEVFESGVYRWIWEFHVQVEDISEQRASG